MVIEMEQNGAIQDIRGELLKKQIEWDYSKAANVLLWAGVLKLSDPSNSDKKFLIDLMAHEELPINENDLKIAGGIAKEYVGYIRAILDDLAKEGKV